MSSQFVYLTREDVARWSAGTEVLLIWEGLLSRMLSSAWLGAQAYANLLAFWEQALGQVGAHDYHAPCVHAQDTDAVQDDATWRAAQRAACLLGSCGAQLPEIVFDVAPQYLDGRPPEEFTVLRTGWRRCCECSCSYDPDSDIKDPYRGPPYNYRSDYCLACWLGVGPFDLAKDEREQLQEELRAKLKVGKDQAVDWLVSLVDTPPDPASALGATKTSQVAATDRWTAGVQVLQTWETLLNDHVLDGRLSEQGYTDLRAFWEVALGKKSAGQRAICVYTRGAALRAASLLSGCDAQVAKLLEATAEEINSFFDLAQAPPEQLCESGLLGEGE